MSLRALRPREPAKPSGHCNRRTHFQSWFLSILSIPCDVILPLQILTQQWLCIRDPAPLNPEAVQIQVFVLVNCNSVGKSQGQFLCNQYTAVRALRTRARSAAKSRHGELTRQCTQARYAAFRLRLSATITANGKTTQQRLAAIWDVLQGCVTRLRSLLCHITTGKGVGWNGRQALRWRTRGALGINRAKTRKLGCAIPDLVRPALLTIPAIQ